MATYKVIQDIEAEDKLLGPLTLKQFIYAGIAALLLYICFFTATRGAAWAAVIFLPPAVFFGIMAFPWSREQPTEVWLLAKIRFFLKPRRRIWDPSGVEQLVTITAPKRPEKVYTDNLSETEVKSRLKALADTIDSRGWAIKNVDVNMFAQPALGYADQDSDRLINLSALPQQVATVDVRPADDMLDEHNNPTAQHLDQMIKASADAYKQQIRARMQQPDGHTASNQPWFMKEDPKSGPQDTGFIPQVVAPGSGPAVPATAATTAEEKKLLEKIKTDKANQPRDHHKVIRPISDKRTRHDSHAKSDKRSKKKPAEPRQPKGRTMTRPPDPAILELANNDDLNVATIARQANRAKGEGQDGEVVISLR